MRGRTLKEHSTLCEIFSCEIFSLSDCSFSAFISEVDTNYIFRVLSIPSDPFQELPILSFEIFADGCFSDGFDSGERANILPIRLSVHRVGCEDSSELYQENGFESSS